MRWAFDDAAAMLKLTIAQASRLWHLDPASSQSFLEALVVDGVLRRKADGVYLVASDTSLNRSVRN